MVDLRLPLAVLLLAATCRTSVAVHGRAAAVRGAPPHPLPPQRGRGDAADVRVPARQD